MAQALWITAINEALDRRGWSQTQLANATGISDKTISRWLRGKVKRPPHSGLYAIATHLDLDYGQLAILAGHPPQPIVGEPDEQMQRLQALVAHNPWVAKAMEGMSDLPPEQVQIVLAVIESLRQQLLVAQADRKADDQTS